MGNCKSVDIPDSLEEVMLDSLRRIIQEAVEVIVPNTVEESVRQTMDKVQIESALKTPSSVKILEDTVEVEIPLRETLDLNPFKHIIFISSITDEKIRLETRKIDFEDM